MILSEPPRSPADLNFALFGIPVRIHFLFWIVCLLISPRREGNLDPQDAVIFVVVALVSVLVHEFGHALTQRYFGGNPYVVLHGMGGLAICGDCDRRPSSQIKISLAGPGAGFCLAILIVALLALAGSQPTWSLSGEPGALWIGIGYLDFTPPENILLHKLVWYFLAVNTLWGILNLLPIYPLDGGQVARELFTMRGDVSIGITRSLWLSVIAAGCVAVFALANARFFATLLFGYLAYSSYRSLEAYQRYGGRNRPW